jgi:DNA-binding MarR family transcriptional regulator
MPSPTRRRTTHPTEEELVRARAEIFGSIFVVVQHLTRRTDAELTEVGLTTRQWLLLAVLTKWFVGRDPSLTEAAERYGSSRQNVKQIALGLEARGYLQLVPDPADGRATRLRLTDKVGIFDRPEAVARQAAMLADVTAGLTGAETLVLRDLVVRWLTGVSAPGATVAGTSGAGASTAEGVAQ